MYFSFFTHLLFIDLPSKIFNHFYDQKLHSKNIWEFFSLIIKNSFIHLFITLFTLSYFVIIKFCSKKAWTQLSLRVAVFYYKIKDDPPLWIGSQILS